MTLGYDINFEGSMTVNFFPAWQMRKINGLKIHESFWFHT